MALICALLIIFAVVRAFTLIELPQLLTRALVTLAFLAFLG